MADDDATSKKIDTYHAFYRKKETNWLEQVLNYKKTTKKNQT